jgi:uncharacterized protein
MNYAGDMNRVGGAAAAIMMLATGACAPVRPLIGTVPGLPPLDGFVAKLELDPRVRGMLHAALQQIALEARVQSDGTVYVQTGDIPAEWLRDSSVQVRPLLFLADDAQVARFLRGVIARQARYVAMDPYANAFTIDNQVWERKFELDSLAYPVTLAWTYFQRTHDAAIFTPNLKRAFDRILDTLETEQDHAHLSSYFHEELPEWGMGGAVAPTGMIWTGFRPSDDVCEYPYLIPSEMLIVVALGELAALERDGFHDDATAARATSLASQVRDGIERYGVVPGPDGRPIYAYETDGLFHYSLIDDANVPSLLAAPYLGFGSREDPLYESTRAFVLSARNPYYYKGRLARGEGSPHTPEGWVWPLGLIAEALTASTAGEKEMLLDALLASDLGDHRLHESFNPDDPRQFTRQDFAWPNALFAEYALTELAHLPALPTPRRP